LQQIQIGSILELVANFVKYQKQQKFCKNLPKASFSADPLAWIKYCINSIREMV